MTGISCDDLVNAAADRVAGVGDEGDAVPGHGAKLDHNKHERQHVLPPPEGGAEGEEEGGDHHYGGDHPRLGEHGAQLLHRAHQEQRAAQRSQVTQAVSANRVNLLTSILELSGCGLLTVQRRL